MGEEEAAAGQLLLELEPSPPSTPPPRGPGTAMMPPGVAPDTPSPPPTPPDSGALLVEGRSRKKHRRGRGRGEDEYEEEDWEEEDDEE